MKKLFSIKQFFFMGIILCNITSIFGQDTTRYFISATVDFDQWCNCSNSEPTFDSARIFLTTTEEVDVINADTNAKRHVSVEKLLFTREDLRDTLSFSSVLINVNDNNSLKYLQFEDVSNFEYLYFITNTKYIANDKVIIYYVQPEDLHVGVDTFINEASDPCNNIISHNREGYTVTVKVFIEVPVDITHTDDSSSYTIGSGKLSLHVNDFYKVPEGDKAILQVALDNGKNNWDNLSDIIVNPGQDLILSYEDIARSNYFEWQGRNLKFRVIKKMLNGQIISGNEVAGIRFYPNGLDFTINDIRRTYCDYDVNLLVDIKDDSDAPYFSDTSLFSWKVSDGMSNYYNCIMKFENNQYIVNIPTDMYPINPFNEPNKVDMNYILQLQTNDETVAVNKPFTIPARPDSIIIIQDTCLIQAGNGQCYEAADASNPVLTLEIEDKYLYYFKRQPYILLNGQDTLVVIDSLPSVYSSMSQPDIDSMNTIYESEWKNLINREENYYKSYLETKLTEWCIQREDPVLLEGGINPVLLSDNSSYVYLDGYDSKYFGYNIYYSTITGDAPVKLTTIGLAKDWAKMSAIPNGNIVYFVGEDTLDSFNERVYAVNLGGGNPAKISPSFVQIYSIQYSGSYVYILGQLNSGENFAIYTVSWTGSSASRTATKIIDATGDFNNIQFSSDGSFFLFTDYNGNISKYNIASQTCTQLTEDIDAFPVLSPDNKHFIYGLYEESSNNLYIYYAPVGNSINNGVKITNDIATFNMRILNDNTGFLLADGYFGSVDLGEGVKSPSEQFVIRKIPITGGINNGIKLHEEFRSEKPLGLSSNDGYVVYYDSYTKEIKFYILDVENAVADLMEAYYPDKGFISTWHDEFKEKYKKRWLNNCLGIKITEGIIANDTMQLTLRDADDCNYNFNAYVRAPDSLIYRLSVIKNPTDACSSDGSVSLTILGGGALPYYHNRIPITNYGTAYILEDLGYGDIVLLDSDNLPFDTITSPFNSIDKSITIVSTPQTCNEANGTLNITIEGIEAPYKYYITPEFASQSITGEAPNTTWTIPGLSAGNYTVYVEGADVEGSVCTAEGFAVIESEIFDVTTPTTTDATTINSSGSVAVSFENRVNAVSWGLIGPITTSNTIYADATTNSGLPSGEYDYTASHTDNYNSTCEVTGSFTIEGPQFAAEINIRQLGSSCFIGAKLSNSNSLLSPYYFSLVNNSGVEIGRGDEGSFFSDSLSQAGTYSIYLHYADDEEKEELYTFTYPLPAINNEYTIAEPRCPGDNGTVTLNPTGGFGSGTIRFSADGLTFTSPAPQTVKKGDFYYYLRDTESITRDISGNAVNINLSQTTLFSVYMPEPEAVNARIIEVTEISCAGSNNGSVSVRELTGGSGTYRFRVDSGAWYNTSQTITELAPGYRTLWLQDNVNLCPAQVIASINVQEPDTIKIDTQIVAQPKCELPNGSIQTEIEGGNGYYTYFWEYDGNSFLQSDSLLTDTVSVLGDTLNFGLYALQVTDIKNCTFRHTIQLNEYFNPSADSVIGIDAACFGDQNGSIEITGTKGTSPTEMLVLNDLLGTVADTIYDTTGVFTDLQAGKYEVTIVDSLLCSTDSPYPVVINQPDTILYLLVDTISPVINKGSASGRIYSTIFSGNEGVKTVRLISSPGIEIDSMQERSEYPFHIDSIRAGKYTLSVIDAKGCNFETDSITVIEPDTALSFVVSDKQDALCKAYTGSFTINPTGGWGGYRFKKASDNGYTSLPTFSHLYAGNYLVSVRDKLGAIYTDTISIYEPKDSLMANVFSLLQPTCENNGTITLDVSGGTSPYRLYKLNETDTVDLINPQLYTYTNQQAGNYLFAVNDSNGCRFNLETSLYDSSLLQITEFVFNYPSGASSSDGAITVHSKGGNAPISYSWQDFDGNNLPGNTATLSNVASGQYFVILSEASGCSITERVYLPAIGDKSLTLIETGDETSYQTANGYAILENGLSEVLEFEVIYPNNSLLSYSPTDVSTGFRFRHDTIYINNLSGGSYFISATDISGAKAYSEFTILPYPEFTIEDKTIIHVSQPGGSDGTATISVSGGAGGNTYTWMNLQSGALHTSTTDFENTSSATTLAAGAYSFTATDKYGNAVSDTLTLEQPGSALNIIISDYNHASCAGFEDAWILLQAEGGWGDYQFRPDNESYYSNNANWTNLGTGEHYFYLTDKSGAKDSIAMTITDPDYLHASIDFTDSVNCKNASDGNFIFQISGGTKPYKYAFVDDSEFWLQDSIARNLSEGNYAFVFSDNNNCTGQDTLQLYMPEPDSLQFGMIDTKHTTCNTNNGRIRVSLTGGTRPYRYEWLDFKDNRIGSDSLVNNLAQNGYYFLNVWDKNDCPQNFEQLIHPSENPSITDIDTTEALCYGDRTGTAKIISTANGKPYAPWQISWENSDTGMYSQGYSVGMHSATITDTNNCSTTKYFEITGPDSLWVLVAASQEPHCFGYSDGYIEVEGRGGVGKYSYLWSNGDTTGTANSLTSGSYRVILTDSNHCSYQRSIPMGQPNKVIVDLGDDLKICPGNTITLDGNDFASHKWETSSGLFSKERFVYVEEENTYYLEVTDSTGCFAHDTIDISIGNDALNADFLMTSAADLTDTLIIFELSNMELDSMQWEFNNKALNHLVDTSLPDYVLHLETLQEGIFNVNLWAYSGGCMSRATKQVEISATNDTINNDDFLGYQEPLIQSFIVSPNPNNGTFRVLINLREEADIRLVIFNISFAQQIDERLEYGLSDYEVSYKLDYLNSGSYLIILDTGGERKQIKVIVE